MGINITYKSPIDVAISGWLQTLKIPSAHLSLYLHMITEDAWIGINKARLPSQQATTNYLYPTPGVYLSHSP